MSETLPPLPESVHLYHDAVAGLSEYLYTADQMRAFRAEGVAAERERRAKPCDDEARIRTEAGNTHPEDSESRSRCFAAARAAMNCAKGVRNGEEV